MNFLKKFVNYYTLRTITTSNNASNRSIILENLKSRSLLRVHGNDVVPYLQGLITNDINHLTKGSNGMYAMFLNKNGRVLYDTIIYKTANKYTYLIECDKLIVNELKNHLNLFKVRRKIDIDSISGEYNVWVAFNRLNAGVADLENRGLDVKNLIVPKDEKNTASFEGDEILLCQDPRVKRLGARIIVPRSYNSPDFCKVFRNYKLNVAQNNEYKELRYSLGIGEGITDLPPSKCFPLEANCDYLHGVSFQKGCYIGQEFTARTHHTGVIRKRLMPLQITGEGKVEDNAQVHTPNGQIIGKLRSLENKSGIALLRVEPALDSVSLFVGSFSSKTAKPYWWPVEANTLAIKEKLQK